jgi:hypothetical protein
MDLTKQTHPTTIFDKEAKRSGMGANAIWNGPFDTTSFPKGKGSSSGKNGIILNTEKPMSCGCPITQRVKKSSNGAY